MSIKMEQDPKFRRLAWKCRRGLLELDYLLNQFLNLGYNSLSLRWKNSFEALLETSDQQLLEWLLGIREPENAEYQYVVKKIRSTAQA